MMTCQFVQVQYQDFFFSSGIRDTNTIFCCNRRQLTKNDVFHNSQNTPVPYPIMLHSEQKCTHFFSEWSIVGYGTAVFSDLWNWSII